MKRNRKIYLIGGAAAAVLLLYWWKNRQKVQAPVVQPAFQPVAQPSPTPVVQVVQPAFQPVAQPSPTPAVQVVQAPPSSPCGGCKGSAQPSPPPQPLVESPYMPNLFPSMGDTSGHSSGPAGLEKILPPIIDRGDPLLPYDLPPPVTPSLIKPLPIDVIDFGLTPTLLPIVRAI